MEKKETSVAEFFDGSTLNVLPVIEGKSMAGTGFPICTDDGVWDTSLKQTLLQNSANKITPKETRIFLFITLNFTTY